MKPDSAKVTNTSSLFSTIFGIVSVMMSLIGIVCGGMRDWETCRNEGTGFKEMFTGTVRNFTRNHANCTNLFQCKVNPLEPNCSSRCRKQCAFAKMTEVIDDEGNFSDEKLQEFMGKFSDFQKKEELSQEFKNCGKEGGRFTIEKDCSTFDDFLHCVMRKYEEVCNDKE